ncbi:MAG: GNAT family N-acetyltransferase [Bacillota bacterium]
MLQVEEIFRDLPELETERLRLIKPSLDRTEELFVFAGDPEATEFMTWETNKSPEQTRNAIIYMMGLHQRAEVAPWLILHKESDRVIGMTGYHVWIQRHGRAEIHYALARPWWGQGLATEAVRAVLGFGFERMELNRIEAMVHPRNTASRRVLAKVGMVEEGLLREAVVCRGVPTDHLICSIVRREWGRG